MLGQLPHKRQEWFIPTSKRIIRAEVIAYEDFVQYGSEAKCKEAGKFKVEGNVVKDGDVMHFRFNV
jgi:ribosome-binding ATPase YchF (GTP1/OBG family)